MRKGFLGSLASLLAGTGLALAQPPAVPPDVPSPVMAPADGEGGPAVDRPEGAESDPAAPGFPAHPPLQPLIPPRTTPPGYAQQVTDSGKDEYDPYDWYGGVEYLHWWIRGAPTPPLVTTGPAATRGVLGAFGTQVLIGNDTFTGLEEDGARFTLGTWLSPCSSVEATYFTLSQGKGAVVSSSGTPLLSRPFFNVLTNQQDVASVALPGLVGGSVAVREDSRLWGGEVNYRQKLKSVEHFNILGLVGARYLELNEGLAVNENIAILPTVPVIGGLGALALDQFGSRNHIYAGQVGVEAEWTYCRLFINTRVKLGLGADDEDARVAGSTTNTGVTPTRTVSGGLLALPSNIGTYSRTQFVVVPEGNVNVGAILSDRWRASVGYNFLYISQVLRPGNQIDQGINPAQGIPGSFGGGGPAIPARPTFISKESSYWAQGLTVSLEFRF